MSIFKLKTKFKPMGDQPQAIEEITNGYTKNIKEQTLLGVTGSGKTFTMANVIQKLGKKTLVLAHNKTLAAQLYAEFREFFPENAVEYFVSYYDYYQPEAYVPTTDTYIEKDSAINDEIDRLRHSATRSLLEREDVIVISSVSCIYGIGSPEEYSGMKLTLFSGDNFEKSDLLNELVRMQYERNDMDFSRGGFRVRGDIIEIFPSHEESNLLRVEFFDDEIESLEIVDPISGEIIEELKKMVIYPSSHYVVGEEKMKEAIKTITVELRQRLGELKDLEKNIEANRLEQRTLLDIEMMEEMGFCSGIENYSRHLTGISPGEPPPTLIDYFGEDFLLIADESHISISQVGGMFRGDRARKMNLVDFGFRLPSALDNRPLNFQEFEEKLDKVLYVSATPGNYELERTRGEVAEQLIRPTGLLDPMIYVKDAQNQVDDLLIEVRKEIEKGRRVLVTTLTKKLAEELTKYYRSLNLKIKYLHSDIDTIERVEIIRDLRSGEFDILVGINLLREGLDIPEVSLVAILDADKEGFLRSDRSLIQTIGRAARNEFGRVIMYAYKMTGSMQRSIDETKRRRKVQQEHNKNNDITPTTIVKDISSGVLETLRGEKRRKKKTEYTDDKNETIQLNNEEIEKEISELKVKMKQHAKNLEFEEAAKIRDQIKVLNEMRLLI
jgi:excinuclease ABC subunit B